MLRGPTALALATLALFAWGAHANSLPEPAPLVPPAQTGAFPAEWIYGADCANEPDVQVHRYNQDLYILRQSPCADFEAPFLYMLFGSEKVLLLDTGSAASIDLEPVVSQVIDTWLQQQGVPDIHLVVAHTHNHGDHIRNDDEFVNRPNTTLVPTPFAQMQQFWGFTNWPNEQLTYDLGGRVLDLLAMPGHPGELGLFFYGPESQRIPLAQGYLCVSEGAVGIQRLVPPLAFSAAGHLDANWISPNHPPQADPAQSSWGPATASRPGIETPPAAGQTCPSPWS